MSDKLTVVCKILFNLSAAVFGASFVLLSGFSVVRTGHVEWRLAFSLAFIATALFTARTYIPLRVGVRRVFIRSELRRKRDRIRALGAAVNELIHSMARLSPGDLSLYHTLLNVSGAEDTPCVVTTQGSPNHNVLVQMTDLKLANPEEFNTVGVPPHIFTSVRYALTPFGQAYVPKLMPDVMRLRSILADGRAQSDRS